MKLCAMYWTVWMLFTFKLCLAYQSLLYATSREIRIVNLTKPKKNNVVVTDTKAIFAFAYCYDEGLICWAATSAEKIDCISYSNNVAQNRTTQVKSDLPSVEGLACDWLTRKIYWTDNTTKKIKVFCLKHGYVKVLFWQEIDQPRGIAVDPLSGLFFWTDWGDTPKIERASMNGNQTSRKILISNGVFWPNSLTLDLEGKQVFWIDAHFHKIEVIDYDGKNREILLQKDIKYPFALTRYNNILYWSDWKDYSIHAYNFSSKGSPIELFKLKDSPMDIEVWDPSHQPRKSTPCDINNGGCSHLCLLSSTLPGYSCACPTGIKNYNSTTCSNGLQQLLLLVQRTEINKMSLDTPDYTNFKIPLKGIKRARAIDYDPVDKYFYWTDDELRKIGRAKLDGTNQENLITCDTSNSEIFEGIAIDWIARNIYFSNNGASRIEVLRLNTSFRKAIIINDIDNPRAVTVSPQQGWLYWSDWSEDHPKIERTYLDGSNRVIIAKDRLKWPNGIALDVENNKVYWGDAGTDKIEVANMDGKDRRELVSDSVPHVFGLTITGNYLYWTDWQGRTLERVNKNSGQDRQLILDQLHDVMGIKAVDTTANLGQNLCSVNNGDCQQFCFYKPDNKVVCSCQIEYELLPDGKSCVIPEAFLVLYSSDHLRKVSIQNNFNSDVIPITETKSISAIDVDINDSRLYWADNKQKSINRAFLNGSQMERIIEFGVHSPESLAIDWLSSNIYWADAGNKRIEVAKLNGSFRKTLLWKNLKEPRNLVLDPRIGYMFWSEWDGKNGGIYKAFMDGTNKFLFISDVGRINGLTVDYSQRFLYWTVYKNDVASIEMCDYKGENRRQILSNKVIKPMSITQHNDDIFWVNYKNGSIIRANKFTGSDAKILYTQVAEISDLRMVHSSKQSGWNACTGSNECKNLCLVRPGSTDLSTERVCACPTHYSLKNGICYAPEHFLLFSFKNTLYRMLPISEECPDVPLLILGMKSVRAIEYDPATKYIYWIDGKAQVIRRSYENDSHSVVVVGGSQNGKSFHFYDIALEPYNKLLFWSCSISDSINVTRLSNSSLGYVYKATNGEKPRNLALHPEKSLLFWTDVGKLPRITRSLLDGQGRIHIVEGIQSVTSITVDREMDLLFYTSDHEIFSCDLNGKKKTKLVSIFSKNIASLAVIESFLYYWVEYADLPSCIERINKIDGRDKKTMVDNVQVTDIVSVNTLSESAVRNHPCSSVHFHGNCSYLCVRNSTMLDRANCACPIGLRLNEDRRTCDSPPPCGEKGFRCAQGTGECIPADWRCDGNADCPDESDEMGCYKCEDGFKCNNGHCVELNAVCNGIFNCADHSDEVDCCEEEFLNLGAPYFRCLSEDKCISRNEVCDGWKHCSDASDEINCDRKRDASTDDNSNFVVIMALALIFLFLVASAYFVLRCKKRFKRSSLNNDHDRVAFTPLPPNGRQIATITTSGTKSISISHSVMNGGGSTGSYDRSHITGASSSISMNNYPLNPPPSPATTILREECCCNQYSPPPPTPCSTDVCDESDTNYKTDSDIYSRHSRGVRYSRYRRDKRFVDYDDTHHSSYKIDYDLCPPPPTPRSNSSDPPSPSSSTYFKPSPRPPPPSPTL